MIHTAGVIPWCHHRHPLGSGRRLKKVTCAQESVQCFSRPWGCICLLKHPEEGTRLPCSCRGKAPAPPWTCLMLESHLSHMVDGAFFEHLPHAGVGAPGEWCWGLVMLLWAAESQGMLYLSLLVPVPQSSSLNNPTHNAILRVGQPHTRALQKACSKHIPKVFLVLSTGDHKDQDCRSLLKKLETVKCTFEELWVQVKNPRTSQSSAPKTA